MRPVLLGRLGYFGGALPAVLTADAPITALRCDASVAEEATAAVAATGSSQLSAIMHAGGVLQDGLLLQQTAASVRAVCAPKLCFMAHASMAAQLQAVQAFNLFSSVASFVGSAGQANYAAANSALDCWASILQRRGMTGEMAQGFTPHLPKVLLAVSLPMLPGLP